MSGHSRWAGIKHKKAAVDAKKGKVFTRIGREISVAARGGGGKPESNPRLRKAIEDARAMNMPQDNVKRAIQRGTGEIPGIIFEELTFEGYGPGGIAIFVEATTDNHKRTTAEIRRIFSEHGGNMGESGCVAWIFESKGFLTVPKKAVSEDEITSLAIDLGAEDIITDGDFYEITTSPSAFEALKSKLIENKIPINISDVTLLPKNTVPLEGEDARKCLELMNALEDHDDVQNAFANFDIPQEIIDKVSF
ncbi:MAG: YebC/PmpR family DNA-binding transcriptional regulator [Elusimicrobia bacterium]|nr:YebC/PmpR family DNA-binding transcriptional regulator [Candidatus Obscuribacterium magneticum]